jgi:hypothetical protein
MSAYERLDRARDLLAQGEAAADAAREPYHRRAAEEIRAAMAEEPTLGYREVARRVGRSTTWVAELVQWATSVRGAEHAEAQHNVDYLDALSQTDRSAIERRRNTVAALRLRDPSGQMTIGELERTEGM